MKIEFDPLKHAYLVDGVRLPSVTEIIGAAKLTDYLRHIDPVVLAHARDEGIAIHRAVELDIKDDLGALPPWLDPYIAAWRKFKREHGFEPIESEIRMAHPTMGYAGTADLVGVTDRRYWLIDLKRSLYGGRSIGVQTAAYARLWATNGPHIDSRFALVLKGDGNYLLQEYSSRQDDAVFLACLTLFKWKQQGE